MFEALGAAPPHFAHEALLVAAEGKLSKRLGSYGTEHLREEDVEPMALLSLLARIGTSEPVEAVTSLDELAETFDFAHFGRAPAHFDPHDVELLNAKLLHHLDYPDVADRLPEGIGEQEWLVLRGNLSRISDAAEWVPVIHCLIAPPEVVPDDKPLIEEAARMAGGIDWGGDPWHSLTDALKEKTGRKGRALFRPLRLVLTARESGPEMGPLLKLIGRERALERLTAAAGLS
jgi:glutamyl-tRNA synthetase